MNELLQRFLRDPMGSVKRAVLKTIVLPIKYGRGRDYDAAGYWSDRFQEYAMAMKGVGCEGLSEKDNWDARQRALGVLEHVFRQEGVVWDGLRVLEIGCGNGFYADYFQKAGVRDYTGVDITDALFAALREKFPSCRFVRQDITAGGVDGRHDLVLMMDVIQHIVDKEKLLSALRHVRDALNDGGIFVVAPLTAASRRHLFHVHRWSLEEMNAVFGPDYAKRIVSFRPGEDLVVIRQERRQGSVNL